MDVRSIRRSSPGVQMFGPLPTLHRFVLVTAALVVCIGIGTWLGAMPDIPFDLRPFGYGHADAVRAAAFVLVHDFRQRQTRAARARRRVL